MPFAYDGDIRLAEWVTAVLREVGPLKAREVEGELRRRGLIRPNAHRVNKVLRLLEEEGRLVKLDGGRWGTSDAGKARADHPVP